MLCEATRSVYHVAQQLVSDLRSTRSLGHIILGQGVEQAQGFSSKGGAVKIDHNMTKGMMVRNVVSQ